MNKLFGILVVFLLTISSVLATEIKFAQVEGLMYTSSSESSVKILENIITDINKQKNIDFVVFSGNNIAKPNKDDLEKFLKTANKLKSPYYVIIGQKDVNKKKEMSKENYMKIVKQYSRAHKKIESPNYVFEKNKVVFIVADGSKEVIPTPNGYYRENVLEWVDKELKTNKDKNVVILQHFPIIPPAKKENYYTYKADEYLKILNNHTNVKAVVAGNFGVNNEKTYNGVVHISTDNAPRYRIIDIIDADSNNPTFWSTLKE